MASAGTIQAAALLLKNPSGERRVHQRYSRAAAPAAVRHRIRRRRRAAPPATVASNGRIGRQPDGHLVGEQEGADRGGGGEPGDRVHAAPCQQSDAERGDQRIQQIGQARRPRRRCRRAGWRRPRPNRSAAAFRKTPRPPAAEPPCRVASSCATRCPLRAARPASSSRAPRCRRTRSSSSAADSQHDRRARRRSPKQYTCRV